MIVVLMGVSGSGKSTVGRVLAERLGWPFLDADDYHPDANRSKMREGIPLNDEDREPWLRELARMIDEACEDDRDLVLACSALKRSYRDHLRTDRDCVRFVFLQRRNSRTEIHLQSGHVGPVFPARSPRSLSVSFSIPMASLALRKANGSAGSASLSSSFPP